MKTLETFGPKANTEAVLKAMERDGAAILADVASPETLKRMTDEADTSSSAKDNAKLPIKSKAKLPIKSKAKLPIKSKAKPPTKSDILRTISENHVLIASALDLADEKTDPYTGQCDCPSGWAT